MPKKQFYRNQAETIIKKLETRNMKGYYCENKEEALEKMYLYPMNRQRKYAKYLLRTLL